jgi:hypothetical protein
MITALIHIFRTQLRLRCDNVKAFICSVISISQV